MLTKHLGLVLLGAILISASVLAQTEQPSGSAVSPPGQIATSNWMTRVQSGHWQTSKLRGLSIYNNSHEKIGTISDLLVDGSGKVQAVVIGVGGFLGLGQRDLAVPMDQLQVVAASRVNAGAAATSAMGTAGPSPGAGMTGSATLTAPTAPDARASSNMATNNATVGDSNAANDRPTSDHAILNLTRDQVRAAPAFRSNP
ncbi:PRC-barrel domain-containing protein [Microvirga aerophila]|uniref:Photosystem reaction center subunit H n=1 Tax=Microvirga aerophila TaxID=670291 RepID=A0A512C0D1_9HYPH|nr:PRC-barrel domain-containing protein [Microvirga aerophila]GEO17676.1 photosystem reaction center subunit H [Microvirga aerophila]